jgi:uncharacterized membrane protein (DUF4010 family)
MTTDILQRLALALAIGLLIGIERGWRERDRRDGGRAAGIRTHALVGLLGAISSLIGQQFGDLVLGLSMAAFILGFAVFEWREGNKNDDLSATGFVAGVLTFSLSVYAMRGDMLVAASVAVVTTFILAERELIHGFVKRLSWGELRDGLLLLVMTVVLLPLLPDEPVDPWGALNPYQIWLATILIAGVSFGGYIAVKLAGPDKGTLFAGLAGGLVSSTTVTWTFSRLTTTRAANRSLATGIVASWTVSVIRTGILASLLEPSLFPYLVRPIVAAAIVFVIACYWFHRKATRAGPAPSLPLEHPFDLMAVLRFGALIALLLLLVKVMGAAFGTGGLFGLAAITGLADVDPVTISMAKSAGDSVALDQAALVILTAMFANLVAKTSLAFVYGKAAFARPLMFAALAATLVAIPVALLA